MNVAKLAKLAKLANQSRIKGGREETKKILCPTERISAKLCHELLLRMSKKLFYS
jgi:hypothetical protein